MRSEQLTWVSGTRFYLVRENGSDRVYGLGETPNEAWGNAQDFVGEWAEADRPVCQSCTKAVWFLLDAGLSVPLFEKGDGLLCTFEEA